MLWATPAMCWTASTSSGGSQRGSHRCASTSSAASRRASSPSLSPRCSGPDSRCYAAKTPSPKPDRARLETLFDVLDTLSNLMRRVLYATMDDELPAFKYTRPSCSTIFDYERAV